MILDMLSILWIWIWLVLLSTGLGSWIERLLAPGRPPRAASSFWIGWASWLGVLQLAHFAWPVSSPWIAIGLIVAGIAGCAVHRRSIFEPARTTLREHPLAWAIAALVALWLCNRSLGPLLTIDAGLYHLTSIKWAAEHPLVGGLGNLHGRLAFNSSAFLWLASLDGWSGSLRGFQFAPSLLVVVAAGGRLSKILASDDASTRRLEAILLLPLFYAASLMHVSSTSPDWIVLVLGVVLASTLFTWLRDDGDDRVGTRTPNTDERAAAWLTIVALCVAGITVKLSFAALAATILALAGVRSWRSEGLPLGRIAPAFLLAVALLVPWSWRSVELSGYPAYPSTLFATGVSWQVPVDRVEAEVAWIQSWARAPGKSPEDVLGNTDWLGPWLAGRLSNADSVMLLVLPAALCALALLRRPRRDDAMLLLIPYGVATVAWFVAAPDPRFLGSTLWVIAGILAAAPPHTTAMGRVSDLGTLACGVAAVGFALYMATSVGGIVVGPGPAAGRYPLRHVATNEVTTRSGLVLHVPQKGDQCWEATLPCTPYPAPRLGLRREGDPWSGYELKNP